MFYGTDCPSCEYMKKLLEKLHSEHDISVEMRDVWQSESDYRLMENYIEHAESDCAGIPFFINTLTMQWVCGEVDYQELVDWATK